MTRSKPAAPEHPPQGFPAPPAIGIYRFIHAIGTSSLGKGEKGVCYALVAFIDAATGEGAWASMNTLGLYAGFAPGSARQSAQRIMRRLQRRGVVYVQRKSKGGFGAGGGGLTSTYGMSLEALEILRSPTMPLVQRTAAQGSGALVQYADAQGPHPEPNGTAFRPMSASLNGGGCILARRGVHPEDAQGVHPEDAQPSPSIPLTALEHPHAPERIATRGNGLDGQTEPAEDPTQKRDLLEQCGVKGAMLTSIANCKAVTAAEIADTWAELKRDPKVERPTALLVNRLQQRHRIRADSAARVIPREYANALHMLDRARKTSRDEHTDKPKRAER
jgi:hypothetical protein